MVMNPTPVTPGPQEKKRRRSAAERDRSSVFAFPYFDDLKACLESGWSVRRTHDYLTELYGEKVKIPGIPAMTNWRRKHAPTAKFVPHVLITEKLQGVDYKVDVMAHLSRLIPLLEDRVARGLSKEIKEFGDMPMPGNDGVVKTYLEALREWKSTAQDLGLMKVRAPAQFNLTQNNLNANDPKALADLLQTAKEFKELGMPGPALIAAIEIKQSRIVDVEKGQK